VHPSRAIRGRRSRLLEGRRLLIGVTGSIAAVETPRIVRELIRHGADVRAVMSPDATRIVTAEALRFATGHPPITELTGDVEHVTTLGGAERADLYLIAPATANTISKIAHGIDDTVVTSFASVALGGGVPILVAPAMHGQMARNPAVRENLDRLVGWGVGLIPSAGAEGEEKLASPEAIAAAVLHGLAFGPWKNRRTVVIGGASREPIDDVRSIANESSGETAVQLAAQAYYRGAETELWLGASEVAVPAFVPLVRWRTVADLLALVRSRGATLRGATAVWVPAALSDYAAKPRSGKISSRDTPKLELTLTPAPRVLPEIRRRAAPPARIVGFKLEAGRPNEELLARARALREEHDLDWVVANDRAAMGSSTTVEVAVVTRSGRVLRLQGTKEEVAGKLLDDLGRELTTVRPVSRRPPAPRPRGRLGRGSRPPRPAASRAPRRHSSY
jgi:phosphopantothenoylcysteine decarboxylase/phosphopantothenate--cysteine ligase